MKKKFQNQEFMWVVRVYEKLNGEEPQKYELDEFATEEEALNKLKEEYEYALKEFNIYDSEFEGNKARYRTRYYGRIDGWCNMWIVKQKTNYLDMTIEEFYDKCEYKYGSKDNSTTSSEGSETGGFLMELTDEIWWHWSPYSSFKLQGYYYSPHPDDCVFKVIAEGIGDGIHYHGRSYYRDVKMSEVVEDIKNEDVAYYNRFISNVKQVVDAGGVYILDSRRQGNESNYILHNYKDDFCITGSEGGYIEHITAKVKE
jgi:hypothetical protein